MVIAHFVLRICTVYICNHWYRYLNLPSLSWRFNFNKCMFDTLVYLIFYPAFSIKQSCQVRSQSNRLSMVLCAIDYYPLTNQILTQRWQWFLGIMSLCSRQWNKVVAHLWLGHTRLSHGYIMERDTPLMWQNCRVPVTVGFKNWESLDGECVRFIKIKQGRLELMILVK